MHDGEAGGRPPVGRSRRPSGVMPGISAITMTAGPSPMRNTVAGRAVVLEGRLGEVGQGVGHGREGSFRRDADRERTETVLSSTTAVPLHDPGDRPRPAAQRRAGRGRRRVGRAGPRVEDLGYSALTVVRPPRRPVRHHARRSWRPPTPPPPCGSASLTYCNDYRHPVVLAKEAATIDLLSGGRFELGLGAGWMTTDYEQAGIALDRPGVRIARLAEALDVITGLWADGPCTVEGDALHGRAASTASRSRSAPPDRRPGRATDPDRRRRAQDPHPRRPPGRHHRPQHRARLGPHRRVGRTDRHRRGHRSRRSAGSARRPATGSTTSSCRSGCTWPPSPTTGAALAEAFGPALGLGPEEAMASPHALAGSVVGDRRAVPRAARALRHQLHRARASTRSTPWPRWSTGWPGPEPRRAPEGVATTRMARASTGRLMRVPLRCSPMTSRVSSSMNPSCRASASAERVAQPGPHQGHRRPAPWPARR